MHHDRHRRAELLAQRKAEPRVDSDCLVIVLIFGVTDYFVLRPLAARFSVNQDHAA